MTPTQFEKHAGRGACKKWKISVRLLEADGTSRPIKQWLDVRAFFAFMLTSSLAVSVHPLNISTVGANRSFSSLVHKQHVWSASSSRQPTGEMFSIP